MPTGHTYPACVGRELGIPGTSILQKAQHPLCSSFSPQTFKKLQSIFLVLKVRLACGGVDLFILVLGRLRKENSLAFKDRRHYNVRPVSKQTNKQTNKQKLLLKQIDKY